MSQSAIVPPEGIRVLEAFIDASKRKDLDGMKACLSRSTLESGSFNGDGPTGVDFIIGEPRLEGTQPVVPLRVVPEGAGPEGETIDELPCIMVEEDGAWKFDLDATMNLQMGDIQEMMEEVGKQMGAALGGIAEGIANAFNEAFGSDEQPPNWSDAPDEPRDFELFDVPELTALPKIAAACSEAVGSPVEVLADVKGVLELYGSDEFETIFNWFDNDLMASWPARLAEINGATGLKNRLRAIRLHSVWQAESRKMYVDGNDLVYCLDPRTQAGFYPEADVAEMLPGMLAGLPERINPAAAGKTEIPAMCPPSIEDCKETAARWMKKISAVVGRDVALRIDWNRVQDAVPEKSTLYLWGLNRVYGGLVYACRDEQTREKLRTELRGIILETESFAYHRKAKYEDGVLAITISPGDGERGCLYEHQIAHVLAGNPIESELESGGPGGDDDGSVAAGYEPGTYTRVIELMERIELAMRQANMWPGSPPEGGFEVRGAFGCESMPFEHWVAWVLFERVGEAIRTGGRFPESSSVGVYATRVWSGNQDAHEVVGLLMDFDLLISSLSPQA